MQEPPKTEVIAKAEMPDPLLEKIWDGKPLRDIPFSSAKKTSFIEPSLRGFVDVWRQRSSMAKRHEAGTENIERWRAIASIAEARLGFIGTHDHEKLSMWIIEEFGLCCLYAEDSKDVHIDDYQAGRGLDA